MNFISVIITLITNKLKSIVLGVFSSVKKELNDLKYGWLLLPTFEALENFFFGSSEQAEKPPYIRANLESKRFMSFGVTAFLLPAFAGFLFYGWRVILVILTSYIAGGLAEALFVSIRKEKITEGFLVTGMSFALVLPPTIPLWMVALGSIFGVIIGKELFGGVGHNIFNPALVGRAFLLVSFPMQMSANAFIPPDFGNILQYAQAPVDAITAATPLVTYRLLGPDALNLADMFFGNIGGSIGETSKLVILISAVLLLLSKIADFRIVFSILFTTVILSTVMHSYFPAQFTPPVITLLSGGFLFACFFMATDPVTAPKTREGRYIYGIFIAVCTLMIRGFSGYPEGVTFAILLGNAFSSLIDEIIINIKYSRSKTYAKK